jgi:signal transduction histidine kinase
MSNMNSIAAYVRDLLRVVECYERCAEAGLWTPAQQALLDAARRSADLDYIRADAANVLAESNDGLQRVKKIVQDLRDYSRAGDTEWALADLHAGLDSTLNIVANEIKYKATVVKSYGALPPIECVPHELNQVFLNMLVNAAQAIEGRGTITLRSGSDANEAWITVADTGSGIAPEHLGRIFDPFFTTKPVGQGTGLGLSLSYNIVRKHGGRIEVDSERGVGTTFRIVLPLRQPRSDAAPAG